MRAHRGLLWLLVAGMLLGAVWLVLPPTTPPLYDVVSLHEGPYRWLKPPPGVKSLPPTSARALFAVGTTTGADIATAEKAIPQARLIILGSKPFRVPAGVKTVVITIRAIAPPATQPAGTYYSNVYRFDAETAGGLHPPLARGADAYIELLAAIHRRSPVIERYAHGSWTALPTGTFIGTHDFIAQNLKSLGDYALVLPGKAPSAGSSTLSKLSYVFAGIAVAALLVLAAVLFLQFRHRSEGSTV
ncbi:MAG TPA: hypothetical protein VKX16_06815 [Chloroflexota bacterium]|nr:hypothetical protein [Chloroflexota bacterium]